MASQRNIERFNVVMKVAATVFPHLRLGQLIQNAVSNLEHASSETNPALFYLEDEELVVALENYVCNKA